MDDVMLCGGCDLEFKEIGTIKDHISGIEDLRNYENNKHHSSLKVDAGVVMFV